MTFLILDEVEDFLCGGCRDDFGGGDELAGVALGVVGAVDKQGAYGGGELLAAYASGFGEAVGVDGSDAGGGGFEGGAELGAGFGGGAFG